MTNFIRLTSSNKDIEEFYVCTDKIVYMACAAGYEGTVLVFTDGKMERVKESIDEILNILSALK